MVDATSSSNAEPPTGSSGVKRKAARKPGRPKKTAGRGRPSTGAAAFPRNSVKKALRVAKAILDQNAGKACSDREAAKFAGVSYHGEFGVEISSALKYGLLSRPEPGKVEVTDLARKILRPQKPSDEVEGLREALLNAPGLGEVYKHYRGENVPDDQFLKNTLVETFRIPEEKAYEFRTVFLESLTDAQLLEDVGERRRVLDVSSDHGTDDGKDETLKKLAKAAQVSAGDSCFVMMPFADPVGGYYKSIYEPAIGKAGLRPVRADDDIFATGKIIDQIVSGITDAKVLVAELTGRNPNVFYELGMAHALKKPVVLVSSTQDDVPFDLQHIRVIYYDMKDPFWGEKLISKVAENILSALKNPQEAILERPPTVK